VIAIAVFALAIWLYVAKGPDVAWWYVIGAVSGVVLAKWADNLRARTERERAEHRD